MKMNYVRTLVNNCPPNKAGFFRTLSIPSEYAERIFKDTEKVVVFPLPDFSGIVIKPAKVVVR